MLNGNVASKGHGRRNAIDYALTGRSPRLHILSYDSGVFSTLLWYYKTNVS